MNNNVIFGKLFRKFDEETKKKFDDKYITLDDAIKLLKQKGYNPYLRESSFIDFCRKLRNIDFHNVTDDYLYITDETIKKLEDIIHEIQHPFKVENKATKNVFYATLDMNVIEIMNIMNEKCYTHIPVYDNSKDKNLVGIFSENTIFQYLLSEKIIGLEDNTIFKDIEKCISINNSKEFVKFVSRDKLYDDVVNDFISEFKKGNKLSCVMVTQNGKSTESIIGILTTWDIVGR